MRRCGIRGVESSCGDRRSHVKRTLRGFSVDAMLGLEVVYRRLQSPEADRQAVTGEECLGVHIGDGRLQ